MDRFYITTPAYYPNDVPHLGHAYTTIAADVIARWKRLEGKKVFFISGLDEHGSKIEKTAREKKMEPQAFVDQMAEKYLGTWKLLNISLDGFIRTSEKRHSAAVIDIFKRIEKTGDIYRGVYEGWYCVPDESYWTETQLDGGKCPQCHREVEWVKEESYFFRLSNYQQKLLDLYKKNPDFISPSHRKKEIINRLNQGLKDLSISRKKVSWGIPVPGDSSSTMYVWMDALTFYLSVLGYPDADYKKFWPAQLHIMAKEILWFHCVIWPAMLMSAGLSLPEEVFAHGWLTVNGEKMSKSKGNFILPQTMVEKYGLDAFRYFLMREIPFGEDGTFSEQSLKERINGELVSDLGNLVSRVLTLAERNKDAHLHGRIVLEKKLNTKKIFGHMEQLELHHTLEEIFHFIAACNAYISETEPWKKEGKEIEEILYNLLESLRIIALLLYPFMPHTSEKINKQLGVKMGDFSDLTFGTFKGKPHKEDHLFEKVK